jgi:hypothetical protein
MSTKNTIGSSSFSSISPSRNDNNSDTNNNNNNNNNKMVIDKPNQFPWKLYDMLDTAEKRNEEHVISWIRNGTAFKVHDRDVFIERYMKKMFNQTKFKSFQRQCKYEGCSPPREGKDNHIIITRQTQTYTWTHKHSTQSFF